MLYMFCMLYMNYLILCVLNIYSVNSYVFDPFHLLKNNMVSVRFNELPLELQNIIIQTEEKKYKIMSCIPKDFHYALFKKLTNKLPEFHKMGDDMLINNERIISKILDSHISIDLKKNMIGSIVDWTIKGDHMGSHILEIYRDMVNHML